MIKITDTAAIKLKELISKKGSPSSTMLRISFGGFGWGGPKLQMTLDESKKRSDKIIESQGVKIVYEADLEDYVKDSVVDYSNSWFDKGFVLRGARSSSC